MLKDGHLFRMLSWGSLCFLLFPMLATYGGEVPSVDEIVEIEKRMIESRRSIQSGRVVVTVRYKTFAQDPSYVKHVTRYTLFFQGNKKRADLVVSTPAQKYSGSVVHTPDTFIRAPSTTDKIIQLFGPNTRPESTLETPDPLRLGLIAWYVSSINQFGLEEHFLRPDREDFRVEPGTVEGEQVWKVTSSVIEQGGEVLFTEYWLAPEKGNLPIYIAAWGGKGENRTFRSVQNKLTQYEKGGVWFPKEVVFRLVQGDIVVTEKIATVEEAEFGQLNDNRLFELSGLNLPEGRLVDSDGKMMWWTGDSLTQKIHGQDDYQGNQMTSNVEGGSRRWFLGINAIVLAILAAAILWLKWHRS